LGSGTCIVTRSRVALFHLSKDKVEKKLEINAISAK